MGKRREFTMDTKLAALDYLKHHSVESTAKEFKVDTKQIRNWRKSEDEIRQLHTSSSRAEKRQRLNGGGRKVAHQALEEKLKRWIIDKRELRQRVSRNGIQREALKLFSEMVEPDECKSSFTASDGWLAKFLKRNGFTLRARTTICSKTPSDCTEKIVRFLLFFRKIRHQYADSSIFVMDETPVWLEPVGATTIEVKGAKQVPIKTAGHEKIRFTVILTARADGTKCKPYVLIPRRRSIPELENLRGLVFNYCGQSWMNDELTADYLYKVIGRFHFGKRLLVWDSFRCHLSQNTKNILRIMNLQTAVIPGGCTSLIQAPDVSWNRSFKCSIQKSYEEWMENGRHSFTKSGNLRPPTLSDFARWIDEAWQKISTEQIKNSMKQCGITTSTDGSENHLIECFKPGNPCHDGLKMLNSDGAALENFSGRVYDHDISEEDDEIDSDCCDSDESN